MVSEVLRSEEIYLYTIVSGQSVFDDSPSEVSLFNPFRDVFLLSWNDATSDGDFLAVSAFDGMQPSCSSTLKKNSKLVPKSSIKRLKTPKMLTWPDAAKASSDDMPVIDL